MTDEAKQQAIADIKQDLKRNHKSFIAFRTDLNKPINEIVKRQLREQTNLKKK